MDRSKSIRRILIPGLTYTVAIACLLWVLRDLDIARLRRHMMHMGWGWVALALLADTLAYVTRAIRWQTLLRPVGRLSILKITQALYAGQFANGVLPMRFGEVVRAYLVSRWLPTELASVIPSVAVERLLDGVWAVIGMGLIAIFVSLPRDVLDAGDALGIFLLLDVGLLSYLVFQKKDFASKKKPTRSGAFTLLRRSRPFLGRLAKGFREIGMTRVFSGAFGLTFSFLFLQAVSFWLVSVAYGLGLSFVEGVAIFLITFLGTIVPGTPANIGVYQFFCVVGLRLFGVEKVVATGFSLVVFFVLSVPFWTLGFLALSKSGMTLYGIKKEISTPTTR
jgi:glycosyltransferase 2 family protein